MNDIKLGDPCDSSTWELVPLDAVLIKDSITETTPVSHCYGDDYMYECDSMNDPWYQGE